MLCSGHMNKSMKLGGGGRFKKLSSSIEKEYEKKGKSPAEAKRIADATAAKIGRKKHGAKQMSKMSASGRKYFS